MIVCIKYYYMQPHHCKQKIYSSGHLVHFLSVELKSLADNIYIIHLLFFLQVMTFWNNKKYCALKVHHNTCMRKHLYTKIG